MSIFLSYSTTNKTEADAIDKYLRDKGYHVQRDIRDINFKDDIEDFCDQIRDCPAAIVLISDAFLKSRWCMFEILKLMQDREFKEKIIPVRIEDARIYSVEERIDYITFWNKKYQALKKKTKGLERSQSAEVDEEMKLYTYIKTEINSFMTRAARWKLIEYNSLKQTGFTEIIAELEKNQKKYPSDTDNLA